MATAAAADGAPPEAQERAAGTRGLPAFKLERFFAKHEFSAPLIACASDCEPLRLQQLLALADPDSTARWENLRLSYGEPRGMPALVEEVCKLYEGVKPEGVLVAAPQECIFLAMTALLRPGDHVVAPFPGYQSLYQVAASAGCEVELWEPTLREDGGAEFEVAAFKALLRPTTRLAVVNFPHNPTGTLLSRAAWSELVEACRSAGCVLFSDEMYRLMELDPAERLPSAVDVYDKAITLGGVSKSLCLPGLRIGWLAVGPALYGTLARVAELKDYTTICSAGTSEVLALMALRARESILSAAMGVVRANLEAVAAFMADFPDTFSYRPPAGGSVAFPRLLGSSDGAEAFCERAVAGCGVLLLPASVYEHCPSMARGHFRLGLGRRDLPACLDALRAFLRAEGR